MLRNFLLATLLLCLPGSAFAQGGTPFTLDDSLALEIACATSHESAMFGPYDARVSIFSVPEADGRGWRLYVGLVDDVYDSHSSVRMWRGPVASGWSGLGPVPEYKPRRSAANPARYRLQREGLTPGGRKLSTLVEIDLGTKPPTVKPIETRQAASIVHDPVPLEEIVPLSPAMRLLPRLIRQVVLAAGPLRLASYEMMQGAIVPPVKRPPVVKYWEVSMDSHLLLVSTGNKADKPVAYFLPMRPYGWKLMRQMPGPAPRERGEGIALEMFAGYQFPDRYGRLTTHYSRNLVASAWTACPSPPWTLGSCMMWVPSGLRRKPPLPQRRQICAEPVHGNKR